MLIRRFNSNNNSNKQTFQNAKVIENCHEGAEWQWLVNQVKDRPIPPTQLTNNQVRGRPIPPRSADQKAK